MRIFILKADDGKDPEVTIRTAKGEARVVWRGSTPPEVGETNVELDVPGALHWGLEVVPAASGERVGVGRDGSLVGAVIGVDPDGVVKLGLDGGLLMIDPKGTPPPLRMGDLISIKGVRIEVYPEDL